jgi:two-component system, NarL family, invasion response regulator UvrY
MKPSTRTSVLLVDDHAIVRSGLRRLLERYPAIEVIAEAESGDQAYRLFHEHSPDVVVLDLSMPDTSGFDVLRRILARAPKARVVVFTMHEHAAMAARAMRLGAQGYISKSSSPEVLVKAVLEAAAGRAFLSPDIAHSVALQSLSGDVDPLSLLTPREFEIFQQFVSGRSSSEIATALKLSAKTIANYHGGIKQKLGVTSDVELVKVALQYNVALDVPAARA